MSEKYEYYEPPEQKDFKKDFSVDSSDLSYIPYNKAEEQQYKIFKQLEKKEITPEEARKREELIWNRVLEQLPPEKAYELWNNVKNRVRKWEISVAEWIKQQKILQKLYTESKRRENYTKAKEFMEKILDMNEFNPRNPWIKDSHSYNWIIENQSWSRKIEVQEYSALSWKLNGLSYGIRGIVFSASSKDFVPQLRGVVEVKQEMLILPNGKISLGKKRFYIDNNPLLISKDGSITRDWMVRIKTGYNINDENNFPQIKLLQETLGNKPQIKNLEKWFDIVTEK